MNAQNGVLLLIGVTVPRVVDWAVFQLVLGGVLINTGFLLASRFVLRVSLAPINILRAYLKIIHRECLCKFQTFNGEDVWNSVRCDDLPDDNPWKTENMCGDPSQATETQACHEDRECAKSDGVGPGCLSGRIHFLRIKILSSQLLRNHYVITSL